MHISGIVLQCLEYKLIYWGRFCQPSLTIVWGLALRFPDTPLNKILNIKSRTIIEIYSFDNIGLSSRYRLYIMLSQGLKLINSKHIKSISHCYHQDIIG